MIIWFNWVFLGAVGIDIYWIHVKKTAPIWELSHDSAQIYSVRTTHIIQYSYRTFVLQI